MKKSTSNSKSTILAIILIALTFALTDPIDLLMPTPIQMTLLGITVIIYLFFAAFIFKESPADEREVYVLNSSSRHAFLVGTSLAMVGITIQIFNHSLDHWLVWVLSGMLITKIIIINKNN